MNELLAPLGADYYVSPWVYTIHIRQWINCSMCENDAPHMDMKTIWRYDGYYEPAA